MFGCVKNVWSVSMISGENNVNVAEIAQFDIFQRERLVAKL